jgi:hypothetical protein
MTPLQVAVPATLLVAGFGDHGPVLAVVKALALRRPACSTGLRP